MSNSSPINIPDRIGQASVGDFMLGLIIIIVAVLLAMKMVLVLGSSSDFDDLQKQATTTSQTLMSEGYPADWNRTNVLQPGVLTDHKLNSSKWDRLRSMSYDDLRPTLSGFYDFYTYLRNRTHVINLSGCGVGSPDVTVDGTCEPDFSFMIDSDIIRVERLVAYNDTIISLVVVLWQ